MGGWGEERERERERKRASESENERIEREKAREGKRERGVGEGGVARRGGRRWKEATPLEQREAVAGRKVKLDRGAWGV